ncbi:hypothetical protein IE53DRAFT_376576 [Violaceomyces palustris]|uniref:Uncharacterized protein n=1 Tax=Violaceomyces palustris TaxID=1673888 RepID=A0ACD0P8I5_9BASI|nr:hypothetical protein IE53DRAFT_376576 [Violaceomyces palustris]
MQHQSHRSSSWWPESSTSGPIASSHSSSSSSRRIRDSRPKMDVKVLYTLDSGSARTMVARVGRPTPVEVVQAPRTGPPSPMGRNDDAANLPNRRRPQPKFGKVTLKTCLSAICIASPELIFDLKRDYSIYALEPEETYRANLQRSPSGPSRIYNTRLNAESSSQASPASTSSASAAQSEPIFGGKGFFRWGLEEEADGETFVTGRVRLEGGQSRYHDNENEDGSVEVLEVVLRMKETQTRSREQYFNLVRGFSSSSAGPSRARQASYQSDVRSASKEDGRSSVGPTSGHQREGGRKAGGPQSSGATSRRTELAESTGRSSSPAVTSTEPSMIPTGSDLSHTGQAGPSPAGVNPQALQLLQLLQTLQSHQSQPGQQAPAPQQQAQLASLLGLVAGALSAGSPAAATMGEDQSVSAAPQEPKGLATSAGQKSTDKKDHNDVNDDGGNTSSTPKPNMEGSQMGKSSGQEPSRDEVATGNTCYNCGNVKKTTWRMLSLPKGSQISYPVSERPAAEAKLADWKPKFTHLQGPIEADGVARWMSCNPCGLYYLKYHESRPEVMWNRALRHDRGAQVAKRSLPTSSETPAKKAKLGQEEQQDSSTPPTRGGTATPTGSGISGGRKGSIPRTLSEACRRETEKIELEAQKRDKRREVQRKSKARNQDLVLDANGEWRTKRSIKDNPLGVKPGRPKGSKKGDGKGRWRDIAKGVGVSFAHSSPADTGRSSPGADAEDDFKLPPASSPVFRAPLPPSNRHRTMGGPSNPAIGSAAQSSPVRPSSSRTPGLTAPFASPSRHVGFGLPNYLLNSSPGTMMDTLMSEADLDFQELCPASLFGTPGQLLGGDDSDPFKDGGDYLKKTPPQVRRSPRKHPHGTMGGENPYASGDVPPSPTLCRSTIRGSSVAPGSVNGKGSQDGQLMLPSSLSPMTRSRTRQLNSVSHPALWTSSDDQTMEKASSNVTSPGSPSPNKRKHAPFRSPLSKANGRTVPRAVRKVGEAASSNNSQSRIQSLQSDGEDDDGEDSGGQLTKGPYRREAENPSPRCPASPSLGRATRKSARTPLSGSRKEGGVNALAGLDIPPSSPPAFDHPTAESNHAGVNGTGQSFEVDGWGRTPSMKDMFPTPSDLGWVSEESPEWQSPGKEVSSSKVEGKEDEIAKDQPQKEAVPTQALVPASKAHVARRPLPATVEDASSSVSGSSPVDGDLDSQDEGTPANLFDLLEDPYGLLSASGFGLPQGRSSENGGGGGMSADGFANIELHRAMEFSNHLNQFTKMGGLGVAAHVSGLMQGSQQAQIATPSPAPPPPTTPLEEMNSKNQEEPGKERDDGQGNEGQAVRVVVRKGGGDIVSSVNSKPTPTSLSEHESLSVNPCPQLNQFLAAINSSSNQAPPTAPPLPVPPSTPGKSRKTTTTIEETMRTPDLMRSILSFLPSPSPGGGGSMTTNQLLGLLSSSSPKKNPKGPTFSSGVGGEPSSSEMTESQQEEKRRGKEEEGEEERQGTNDLMTWFNNPEFQSILAEFGDSINVHQSNANHGRLK